MRVLAVVAHPDDETIGCGGTLARHAADGDVVSVMTFADGVSSRWPEADRSQPDVQAAIGRRALAFTKALLTLGVISGKTASDHAGDEMAMDVRRSFEASMAEYIHDPTGGGWMHRFSPDQRLDREAALDLAKSVEFAIARFDPEVVYTHWPHDLNSDHRAVTQAVLVATRPATGRVRAVYAFETLSSTEWAFGSPAFAPNHYVRLDSGHVQRKLDALRCYDEELRKDHPRSLAGIDAQLHARGQAVGATWAEAFAVLREVR